MRVLVTGAAGFIGYHTLLELKKRGHDVLGLDGLRTKISYIRARYLQDKHDVAVGTLSLEDFYALGALLSRPNYKNLDAVVHLAARPGVLLGSSTEREIRDYTSRNIVSTVNLCAALTGKPTRLIFASSSSVNTFESNPSFYAATKYAGELLVRAVSHKGLNSVIVRPYTVYGEWGRPDMSVWKWTRQLIYGQQIALRVTEAGKPLQRAYTHVSDVVEGLVRLVEATDQTWGHCQNLIASGHTLDLGSSLTVDIDVVPKVLAKALGLSEPVTRTEPCFKEEAVRTEVPNDLTEKVLGWKAMKSLEEGLTEFAHWYRDVFLKLDYDRTGAED